MDKKEILKRIKEIEKKEPAPNEKLVKINMNFKELVKKVIKAKNQK